MDVCGKNVLSVLHSRCWNVLPGSDFYGENMLFNLISEHFPTGVPSNYITK